jgi:hypothetical protein
MLMRISVPAEGGLRNLAGEVGTKIAEYLGSRKTDMAAIVAAIDGLAGNVAPPDASHDIVFEFRATDGELVVLAQCDGRASETRHPLPAEN